MLKFTCNICGTENTNADPLKFHRELMPCEGCGSNPRFRGIILAVQSELIPDQPAICLRSATPRRDLVGLGFSDSEVYASVLERLFSYTNTYYHAPPYLDLMDETSVREYDPVDFVICSDVLEHVPPPAITAFENLRRLVKPGGLLILSVPYLEGYETIEHYPHLHDWRITQTENGSFRVENMRAGNPTVPGQEPYLEIFPRPEFHGGPGAVLEMRMYGEGDLRARLAYAGFQDVKMLEPCRSDVGYVWSFNVEKPYWRGRVGKGFVMACR
jgi:SAM-dependent methyltransferase